MDFDWPIEAVADLRALWIEGLSALNIKPIIEEKYKCSLTVNAVIGKIHREKLSAKDRQPQGGVRRKTVKRPTNHGNRFDVTEVFEPEPLPRELPASAIPIEQRRQLVELTASTCRFPYGTPGRSDFFFCGAHPVGESPYCGYHTRIAYRRAPTISESEQSRRSIHWKRVIARRNAREASQ